MDGEFRALSTNSLASNFAPAESTPRITPRERKCRTKERVSISEMTGTPLLVKNSCAVSSARQLLDSGENSRTAKPSMCGRAASLSRVMSNSFGFGGSNCALVFGKTH